MSMPNYPAILTQKYPDLQWTMRANDPATLTSPDAAAVLPTKDDLDAFWPEVEAQLLADQQAQRRIDTFQARYPLQQQLLLVAQALSPSTPEVDAMLKTWNDLA